jgi:phosphoglycerate dehydrogenase-like enzyme
MKGAFLKEDRLPQTPQPLSSHLQSRRADVVSLHTNLTPETRGFINKQ